MLSSRESEQHLPAAVGLVLPVQGVEAVLEDDETVWRLTRRNIWDHWTVLEKYGAFFIDIDNEDFYWFNTRHKIGIGWFIQQLTQIVHNAKIHLRVLNVNSEF